MVQVLANIEREIPRNQRKKKEKENLTFFPQKNEKKGKSKRTSLFSRH